MNCSKCGCLLSEKQTVCPACGAPQTVNTAPQPQPNYYVPPVPYSYHSPVTNVVSQITVPLALLQIPSIALIIYGAIMIITRPFFVYQHFAILHFIGDSAPKLVYQGFIATDILQFLAGIFIVISAIFLLQAKGQFGAGHDGTPKIKSAFTMSIVYGSLMVVSNFVALVCSKMAIGGNSFVANLFYLLTAIALSAFISAFIRCLITKPQPTHQYYQQ